MNWVGEDRSVFTYAPDDGPAYGLVTAHGEAGVCHVEHVVVFPGAPRETLLRMTTAALEEAWQRFHTVIFCLPEAWYLTRGLRSLGEHFGFVEYAREDGLIWFVGYKP